MLPGSRPRRLRPGAQGLLMAALVVAAVVIVVALHALAAAL